MPQLIKTGNNVFKSGNTIFRYNRLNNFVAAETPIVASETGLSSNLFNSVVVDNDRILVADRNNNKIYILDAANPHAGPVSTITNIFAGFSAPLRIIPDPSGGKIFVISSSSNLCILDYANPATTSPTSISIGTGFINGDIDILGDRLFLLNGSNTIAVYKYSDLTYLYTITQAMGNFSFRSDRANGMRVDRMGGRIFVINCQGQSLSVLNYAELTSGSVTTVIPSQLGASFPTDLEIDRLNNRIFCISSAGGNISIINYTDPASGSSSSISGGQTGLSNSSSISIDKNRNKILVVSGSTIAIITNQFT